MAPNFSSFSIVQQGRPNTLDGEVYAYARTKRQVLFR